MAVRKTKKGAALKRWFKEDWKDVRTGKACGRKKVRLVVRLTADLPNVFLLKPQKHLGR